MRANKFTASLISLVFFLSSCGLTSNRTEVVRKSSQDSSAPAASEAGAENRQVTSPLEKDFVSAIEFEPGRKGLSPEATAEINRAFMEAKELGQITSVNIAVWSDSEYPAGQAKAVPAEQVEIAKERGENLQKYIDRMEPEAKVRIHNMTQQPESFAKILKTQDPKVKSQLAAVGVTTDEKSDDVKGRSSSALVLIEVK